MVNYIDFLKRKMVVAPVSGFDVPDNDINTGLKPHQRDAVRWAVKGGRRALFESFGLGKTAQQLEWCRLVTERMGGRALIVLPLGVRQEFVHDAVNLLGIPAPVYIRNMSDAVAVQGRILMTNYERVRDGDIDPAYFTATSLDEASVLRSFGSKTYQTFLNKFQGVPYKLVCTATPSPNKYKELIHYAGYLEVMDTGQALTRFFQRDSTKANNLTLYPHKEDEFWLWMSTWALFLSKPSDLGYSDEGYDLPPLEVRTHVIRADFKNLPEDRDGQMQLIRNAAVSLPDASKEKATSIDARVEKMAEIVNTSSKDHFILWHDREDERRAIKKALPEAVDIYGSQDYDIREQRTIDFSQGKSRLFATKKSLSGQGCNFQRYCHRAIFLGIDYEFNDFIQAIHRIYRFLQSEHVIIDIIYTEAEQRIYEILTQKWKQHDYLQEKMRGIMKKYGLHGTKQIDTMARSIGVDRVKVEGERFTAVNNDCVLEASVMEDNSVDLIHTSIPFSNHYEYTPSYNDFGHNSDTQKFFKQMDFLSPELLRILKPGRVFACHVKDRVLFGNATGTGMPTIEPFHAYCIDHYMKHGFQYFGMITVETDVVRENNQTYRLGWTEQCKDGSKMGVGCPEYILLFRKLPSDTSKAYADEPITKTKDEYPLAQWQVDAAGKWRTSGDRLLSREEIKAFPISSIQKAFKAHSQSHVYDYHEHVEFAKLLDECGKMSKTFATVPAAAWRDDVWDDINRMRTLNTTQSQRRQTMHVCPLQLDIVARIINRYSNPGELVMDPFAGLMTVPLQAIKMGRKGCGIELNSDYFRDGVGYLKAEEEKRNIPTLFDFVEGAAQ